MPIALLLLLLGQSAVPTVSFDLRPLPVRLYRQLEGVSLERRVALRLAQEGFAFVSPESTAVEIRIEARPTAGGVELVGTSRSGTLVATVRLRQGAVGEWQLELAQKVTELARALTPAPQPAPEPTAPLRSTPELTPQRTPSAPGAPSAAAARQPLWEVDAIAGVIDRFPQVDPLLLLSAASLSGRWAWRADLGGTTSGSTTSGGVGIRVWELQAAIGLDRRWAPVEPLTVSAGLGVGGVVEGDRVDDVLAQAPSGVHLFPAVWGVGRAQWALGPRWKLGTRVAAGVSGTAEHTSEGVVFWSRGPVRVEVGLGVTASL